MPFMVDARHDPRMMRRFASVVQRRAPDAARLRSSARSRSDCEAKACIGGSADGCRRKEHVTIDGIGRKNTRTSNSTTVTDRRRDLMNPNKALWEKGDFTRIAATM